MYGGRGRGRGRATAAPPSVAASAALFSTPATSLPTSASEPSPLFPKATLPEPVDPSTEEELAAVRFAEELSRYMHVSPCYLTDVSSKSNTSLEIDRYSDRYLVHLQAADKKGKLYAINTDLSFFPEELHSVYNVEKAQRAAAADARSFTVKQVTFDETLARLKDLEGADGDNVAGEAEEEEEGEEEEAVYEEEDLEDETDYNLNYFDNGEDYGGDYDDGDGRNHTTRVTAYSSLHNVEGPIY